LSNIGVQRSNTIAHPIHLPIYLELANASTPSYLLLLLLHLCLSGALLAFFPHSVHTSCSFVSDSLSACISTPPRVLRICLSSKLLIKAPRPITQASSYRVDAVLAALSSSVWSIPRLLIDKIPEVGSRDCAGGLVGRGGQDQGQLGRGGTREGGSDIRGRGPDEEEFAL